MNKNFGKTLADTTKNNKRNWKETCKLLGKHKSEPALKLNESDLISQEIASDTYKSNELHIKVFHEKITRTLEECLNLGFCPLLVNCVNGNHPIQALKHGVASTEMDLLRITNLYDTIPENMYPIAQDELVYSPEVLLLKSSAGRILPKPMKFSMVSLTVVRNPNLIAEVIDGVPVNKYTHDSDRACMQRKIHSVFDLAVEHQKDCVIFSDFGCDNVGNPHHMVVDMFNQAISTHTLKYVFFSIYTRPEIKHDQVFLCFHKLIQRSAVSSFYKVEGEQELDWDDEDL